MTFDETRDNITAIEATIMEADRLAREESAPYPPAYPFPVFGGGPVEEHSDGANGYDADRVAGALFAQPHFGG